MNKRAVNGTYASCGAQLLERRSLWLFAVPNKLLERTRCLVGLKIISKIAYVIDESFLKDSKHQELRQELGKYMTSAHPFMLGEFHF